MRTTILQTDIVWADPKSNTAHADTWIDENPGSDLYVFPEMFTTGFATHPTGISESEEGASLSWMKRKSANTGAAICGSMSVQTKEGKYVNRFYFVKPDGSITYYDKHHLFTYGGEDKCYEAGESHVVVEWRGVRIMLLVCYDLRFPIWSRNRNDYYDMIIYVASWPTSRIEAWRTLLKARAIENQCYVAGVNRVGSDPNCQYCGCSAIISPYGTVMEECPRDEASAASTDIDMESLDTFRKKFPVLNDRDF
ncbi:MAG: amidohydrolase [Bacteroidaceae bacterium]|nr:amidohydrolase [Bacteroidaceae bacterium]